MGIEDFQLLNDYYDVPGVYCLTHKPTQKKYVGSSVNIGKRIWEGLTEYDNKSMRGLLISDFKIEVLEECPSDKKYMFIREADWIEELNAYYPNGFNLAHPLKSFYYIKVKNPRQKSLMTDIMNKEEKSRVSYFPVKNRRIPTYDYKIKQYKKKYEKLLRELSMMEVFSR